MSSAPDDKTQSGAASHLPDAAFAKRRPSTMTAVLQVRLGADTPFEGIVEVGTGGPRAFHGWLELMGLVEEARAAP